MIQEVLREDTWGGLTLVSIYLEEMDIVYKNHNDIKIYISDINSITLESLSLNDIGLVISIGCCIDNIYNNDDNNNDNKTTTSITRLSYPDILDQPEQVIIHILNDTKNTYK